MPKKHKLGFGNGRIIEYEDGSAAYIKGAEMTHAFRVQIADVTGFSVTKSGKMLERRLHVLGNGTTLAYVDIPHGTAEKIEGWFRSHPAFGTHAAGTAVAVNAPAVDVGTRSLSLIADELRKLADLRAEGILSDEEFAAQKAKLLS